MQTASRLVRRGAAVCVICGGALTVYGCYRRHYRDEGGERHYGWIAQGHCGVCKVYPALIPSFIRPHKHFKAAVIERVIEEAEAGNNIEELSGCAADISTMRRWVRQFNTHGAQAVGWLISTLQTVYQQHVSTIIIRNMTLLKQLARLLCEFPVSESGGVISRANIVLTTQNCGFL